MKFKGIIVFTVVMCWAMTSFALEFKIGITEDQKGDSVKFAPLVEYFKTNGIEASFITAKNYWDAARMFSTREIDGMFCGSGIAGSMIIKNLAVPVARPVSQEGWSTYRAVILAPVGSPPFLNNPNYFDNKKVAFCRLASSGEFFFRSITNKYTSKAIITKAVNHDAAINMLSAGLVDIAIVKDRVWDKHKEKYLKIAIVGSDPGENPDGTLILAKTASPDAIAKISSILLGLEKDTSDIGTQVKTALRITGFINTTEADFKSTLDLLKKAGVTELYDFQ